MENQYLILTPPLFLDPTIDPNITLCSPNSEHYLKKVNKMHMYIY